MSGKEHFEMGKKKRRNEASGMMKEKQRNLREKLSLTSSKAFPQCSEPAGVNQVRAGI